MQENIPERVAGNTPKSNLLENSLGEENDRFSQILEKLDLKGIESWTEQWRQSLRELLKEYQHLFALNLKELGKTALVQHDIKGVTVCSLITEVKQLGAQLVLGWVTI